MTRFFSNDRFGFMYGKTTMRLMSNETMATVAQMVHRELFLREVWEKSLVCMVRNVDFNVKITF